MVRTFFQIIFIPQNKVPAPENKNKIRDKLREN